MKIFEMFIFMLQLTIFNMLALYSAIQLMHEITALYLVLGSINLMLIHVQMYLKITDEIKKIR